MTTSVSSINFTGAGQTTTAIGNAVTVNIPGSIGTAIVGETPTGAVVDNNLVYTLAHTPIAGTFELFYASRLVATTDYTLVGTTITMTAALSPGSTLQANYSY